MHGKTKLLVMYTSYGINSRKICRGGIYIYSKPKPAKTTPAKPERAVETTSQQL